MGLWGRGGLTAPRAIGRRGRLDPAGQEGKCLGSAVRTFLILMDFFAIQAQSGIV
jgi:hypothetical protein